MGGKGGKQYAFLSSSVEKKTCLSIGLKKSLINPEKEKGTFYAEAVKDFSPN